LAAWCVALVLGAPQAWASPDDDYRRGVQAYGRADVVAAMAALRPAAKAGHAAAQTLLAFILDKADFPEEAVRLYRDAAAQGDTEAMAALAGMQLTGRGVAKDEKQALAGFSKAADLGHELSIRVVADAYLNASMGLRPGQRDDKLALAALRRAADRGHLGAAEGLAQTYRDGDFGQAADPVQAAQWRSRAAEIRAQRAVASSQPKSSQAKP